MNTVLFFIVSWLGLTLASKLSYKYVGKFSNPRDLVRVKRESRFTGSVYYVSSTPSNWGDAWFTCEAAMNGKLLAVENLQESLFIKALMIKDNIATVWTSGAFDTLGGIWRWASTGELINYSPWGPGEPRSNNSAARVVVAYDLFNSYWIADDLEEKHHSICETSGEATTPLISTSTTPIPTKTTTLPTTTLGTTPGTTTIEWSSLRTTPEEVTPTDGRTPIDESEATTDWWNWGTTPTDDGWPKSENEMGMRSFLSSKK